ncbi:ABC-2 transporter permease [Clostridium drakei]|uniref:ABC-2 transporter permease n=1 Tax=Clostridium drakei TaxID=332101 RepID=A0A2U8DUP0_9CLOT|nr:ABC-2 transporter permease [Clostridium drakei]AWI06487.1 hypothetical protein B9W14_18970 [Clostridium drakei]
MLNLVLKDVLIQKKYLIVSVLYAFLFSLCFKSNPSMVFNMVPTMIAYLLIGGACAFDDKNKSDIMLNSLPVNRVNLVISKYISSFLFIFIGILLSFIFTTILSFAGFFHIGRLMNLEDIFGASIATLIISCLYLPLFFKFDYKKSKYFLMALFLFVLSSATIFTNTIKLHISFVTYLNSQPDWLVTCFIIVLGLILLLISILISIKFYINKDL